MTDTDITDLCFYGSVVRRVELVDGMALVYDATPNGKDGSHWRFEHLCKTIPNDPVDGATRLKIAPYLSPGHKIVSEDPLTIQGSILCTDCKAHGFVINDNWRSA